MQAPIPTSHHTHTHMLGTHASFHLILMFSWSSSGETLISMHTRIVYPLRRSSDHMQAPIPTSHHTHTHMLGTHASFHLIPMFSWSSSGETLIAVHTRIVYPPRRSSDRGSPA